MLYRSMPRSQEPLSILGYGCMRFPQVNGRIDEPAAERQMTLAIERGVNYFDTAVPYHMGESEPLLGRFLAKGYREKVKLATKLPQWQVKTHTDMDVLLQTQLKTLQTDRIDYYLVHNLVGTSWERMRSLGVLDFLARAKQAGKIRHAGFSYHGNKEAFPGIVDAFDWDFCQIQYNFLDEHNQAGRAGLEYAAKKGLGVIIMEPLRGGNLARTPPAPIQQLWDAANPRRTPAEWALRWIWDHPEVTLVLSGMNSEAQIEENTTIAAAGQPNSLTPQERTLVSEVAAAFRKTMKVPCTSCQYCLPCPHGVDIPGCFETFNSYHAFKDKSAMMFYMFKVGGLIAAPARASQCTSCGACLKKCPQGIQIPEELKQVARDMEGRTMRLKLAFYKAAIGVQRWVTLLKARWFS
jgi:hypothetical protein